MWSYTHTLSYSLYTWIGDIVPWPRGTFAFFVRGSRFAVICASRFSFVLRGSRFAVICASNFTFVLRGSRFLIRGSYFLVRASQFAVRGSWFVVVLEQGGGSAS